MLNCTFFYIEKYGVEPEELQESLKNTVEFRRADPEEIVNAIIFLGLNKEDSSLYWIARVYVSIDPPTNWKCLHMDNVEGKIFFNEQVKQKLNVHPCYQYMLLIIKICKKRLAESRNKSSGNNQAFDNQDPQ